MKTKYVLLLNVLLSQASPIWAMDSEEESMQRTLRSQGHYAVDSRRAANITRTLDMGGNVSIFIDGDITFLRGLRIGTTGNGTFLVVATGTIQTSDVPMQAQSISIKEHTALPLDIES